MNDILAFVTVAREKSFTKASAKLGVTQSAMSQAIRSLEERLEIRLLTRTTRGVSTTQAGQRLVDAIGYRFDDIQAELDALTDLRDKPSGTVRITCTEGVLRRIMLPKLTPLIEAYPDIKVEFDVDLGFVDIVRERFDAGVRIGTAIDKDMIAMPIGPKMRFVVVASPSYFEKYPPPITPQDLTSHKGINQRMESAGGLYIWDFEKNGQKINVRVDGPLIFNTVYPQIDAAILGLGIALLPEDELEVPLREGKLVKVLEDWCPTFTGYQLYYPSRKQPSPAFALVLEALRLK
ncbi:LysR family transcriptional regulator [Methylophilus sp. Leaf414]|uniref:LysR family transcriptional regulator n=1 Tax=Methylophilus sp. Leaf414 TaxID=1736371 RepID=UPI001F31ADD1|nr:LysR family transcriptional regulator [Methylophilus sp. Leaf414]